MLVAARTPRRAAEQKKNECTINIQKNLIKFKVVVINEKNFGASLRVIGAFLVIGGFRNYVLRKVDFTEILRVYS